MSIYRKILPYYLRREIKEEILYRKYPFSKEEFRKNQEFKGKYAGERCFILGNGPSLQSLDFNSLADEYTFTFNQLARNPRFQELKTNFHFWSDARFYSIDKNKKEDMELLQVMKSVNTADNHPKTFYTFQAYEMIKKYELDNMLDIYYFSNEGICVYGNTHYNLEMNHSIQGMPTTVHYAICFAVYMGFKEIYLLGCDCSGFISIAEAKLNSAENALYAYEISENEKKRMERVANQYSMYKELLWAADIFKMYDFLKQYCEERAVKLYNATDGGLLEELPRVDIKTILAKD